MNDDKLLSVLKRYFGYANFRPLQREIVSYVLAGNDALVLMPTGGGKSLCYQLPAMLLEGVTVVISPLISLMKDQVDSLCAAGIHAAALNSSQDENENQAIIRRCLSGEIKILYLSPENALARACYLLRDIGVSLFAIDEAHCVSQWGHDFRPEYAQLSLLRKEFPSVPMMALTATADKVTRIDILQQLGLRNPHVFCTSFDRPNLSLAVVESLPKKSKDKMILAFIHEHKNQSGIIYCLSRKIVESVTKMLSDNGISALPYHAGLSAEVRNQVQEAFVRDRIQVVCATVAFGMGIDKSNIRWVIHYNLPKSIESFYQEIGRAGRDGLPADTLLFYSYGDVIQLSHFAEESGQREINKERLKRMQEYAEATVCRRRILLNYFGENSDCNCENCDVCHHPPRLFDGTIIAQKALSAMMRTNQLIGLTLLIDILRGNYSAEVRLHHYNTLKTFGAGRDVPSRDWNVYILQMLQMGLVEIAYNEDNHLKVTAQGREVLFSGRSVQLAVISYNHTPVRRSSRSSESAKHNPVVAHLDSMAQTSSEDDQLFETLRQLRRRIADAQGYPPYIIFSDKVLHDMARLRPLTLQEFSSVPGVGDFKKAKYGAEFVAAIREYTQK